MNDDEVVALLRRKAPLPTRSVDAQAAVASGRRRAALTRAATAATVLAVGVVGVTSVSGHLPIRAPEVSSAPSGVEPEDLTDRVFEAHRFEQNGQTHELAPGTAMQLDTTLVWLSEGPDGQAREPEADVALSWSGGCTITRMWFNIKRDTLVAQPWSASEGFTTTQLCDEVSNEQHRVLSELLLAEPTLELRDGLLVVSDGTVEVRFREVEQRAG